MRSFIWRKMPFAWFWLVSCVSIRSVSYVTISISSAPYLRRVSINMKPLVEEVCNTWASVSSRRLSNRGSWVINFHTIDYIDLLMGASSCLSQLQTYIPRFNSGRFLLYSNCSRTLVICRSWGCLRFELWGSLSFHISSRLFFLLSRSNFRMSGEGLRICIHRAVFPLDSDASLFLVIFLLASNIICFGTVNSTYSISRIIQPPSPIWPTRSRQC